MSKAFWAGFKEGLSLQWLFKWRRETKESIWRRGYEYADRKLREDPKNSKQLEAHIFNSCDPFDLGILDRLFDEDREKVQQEQKNAATCSTGNIFP